MYQPAFSVNPLTIYITVSHTRILLCLLRAISDTTTKILNKTHFTTFKFVYHGLVANVYFAKSTLIHFNKHNYKTILKSTTVLWRGLLKCIPLRKCILYKQLKLVWLIFVIRYNYQYFKLQPQNQTDTLKLQIIMLKIQPEWINTNLNVHNYPFDGTSKLV